MEAYLDSVRSHLLQSDLYTREKDAIIDILPFLVSVSTPVPS